MPCAEGLAVGRFEVEVPCFESYASSAFWAYLFGVRGNRDIRARPYRSGLLKSAAKGHLTQCRKMNLRSQKIRKTRSGGTGLTVSDTMESSVGRVPPDIKPVDLWAGSVPSIAVLMLSSLGPGESGLSVGLICILRCKTKFPGSTVDHLHSHLHSASS